MSRYIVCATTTKYWRPGKNYLEEIIKSVGGKVADGDFVVVSEKAISVASNNIIDEANVMPNLSARLIAKYWMRIGWGYILGPICYFRERLLRYLREYPIKSGSRHKMVALQNAGFLQALMFGSEGGIDGSNLAYSYVSLPLENAREVALKIRQEIESRLQKKVFVVIADTDKTYSFRNFHFTPRPKPVEEIHSFGGFISYVIGRMLKLKKRATPIAVAGCKLYAEEALEIAEIANRVRGSGAGRTVWDMAERFNVKLTGVSWEMLETVKHKPIILVRKKR
ncbi:coenzyme F420-0:L-glutamate ligase [Candidatus Bathyarchaeota archaeon]|nr:coenzyme F420-0:L-glutamate ligase [Candidatus Bathyarchaeota archaeon]